eukprot:gene17319-biopygen14397
MAMRAALWFARRRCVQLGKACSAVVYSAAARSARQSMQRCGLLGGGVFSEAEAYCAVMCSTALSNARSAGVLGGGALSLQHGNACSAAVVRTPQQCVQHCGRPGVVRRSLRGGLPVQTASAGGCTFTEDRLSQGHRERGRSVNAHPLLQSHVPPSAHSCHCGSAGAARWNQVSSQSSLFCAAQAAS